MVDGAVACSVFSRMSDRCQSRTEDGGATNTLNRVLVALYWKKGSPNGDLKRALYSGAGCRRLATLDRMTASLFRRSALQLCNTHKGTCVPKVGARPN